MDIIGYVPTKDSPIEFRALRVFADGCIEDARDAVQEESLLEVFVNDIPTLRVVCSASDLAELVLGRLYTEGLISSVDEVDALSVCENNLQAYVYLLDRSADISRTKVQSVPTCCTGNRMLNDFFGRDESLHPVEAVPWKPGAVFRLALEFEADKTAHARTKGSHSAFLTTLSGDILAVGEDIGRHNAFDKVVGWALINDVSLEQCMLFTSGRVPTDMVTKAIRAHIPVLISKAVATDKTVRIAQEYGLTLICSASGGHFDILSDPRPMAEPIKKIG